VTHEEACNELLANAQALRADAITLTEWRNQVDLILLQRFPDGSAGRRARPLERGELEMASRTNMKPRNRSLVESPRGVFRYARAASPDGS